MKQNVLFCCLVFNIKFKGGISFVKCFIMVSAEHDPRAQAEPLKTSCGYSTRACGHSKACIQIIRSTLHPQERNAWEDNPPDEKSSVSKNDPNFEELVQLVRQGLCNKNCPFVF